MISEAQSSLVPRTIEACPVCLSQQNTPHVVRPEFTFVRCVCGVVYKSRDAEAPMQHEATYFSNTKRSSGASYQQRQRHRVHKSRRQILDVLEYVEKGPLLDIGCSLGYTLEAARSLGMETAGLDISAHSVEVCRTRGFAAEQSDVDGPYPFADASFQIVTMKHVLEHTANPRGALREVRRVLKPNGGLFIAVPHEGYYKAQKSPSRYHFYLPKRGGSQHMVYYTPDSMRTLLQREGFKVVHVHPHWVHQRSAPMTRLGEYIALPLVGLAQTLLTKLTLRREFWMVAVRE